MNIENRAADSLSNPLDEVALHDAVSGDLPTVTYPPDTAILEAVHLRKYFPLRQFKLFGAQSAVHAV